MLTKNKICFFYRSVNRIFKKQIPVLLTVCTGLSTGITFKPVLLSPLSTLFKVSNHKIGLNFEVTHGMVIDWSKPGGIKM